MGGSMYLYFIFYVCDVESLGHVQARAPLTRVTAARTTSLMQEPLRMAKSPSSCPSADFRSKGR